MTRAAGLHEHDHRLGLGGKVARPGRKSHAARLIRGRWLGSREVITGQELRQGQRAETQAGLLEHLTPGQRRFASGSAAVTGSRMAGLTARTGIRWY